MAADVLSLPRSVRERIFSIEYPPSRGLFVAAQAVGNLAVREETAPEQFTPLLSENPSRIQMTTDSGIDIMRAYGIWYSRINPKNPADFSYTMRPEEPLSPFLPAERETLITMAAQFMRTSGTVEGIVQITGNKPAVLQNLYSRILAAASGYAAMPRILAGELFAQRRQNSIEQLSERIGYSPKGKQAMRTHIKTIPWIMPLRDMLWEQNADSLVVMGKVMNQMAAVCARDTKRLLTPLRHMAPEERFSPFLVSSYDQLEQTIERYPHHEYKILETFFRGQHLNSWMPDPLPQTTSSRRVTAVFTTGDIPAAREVQSDRLVHQQVMEGLDEDPVGRKLNQIVHSGTGRIMIMTAEDGRAGLDEDDASREIFARLEDACHLLFEKNIRDLEAEYVQVHSINFSPHGCINRIIRGPGELLSLELHFAPSKRLAAEREKYGVIDAIDVTALVKRQCKGRMVYDGRNLILRLKGDDAQPDLRIANIQMRGPVGVLTAKRLAAQ